MGCNRIRRTMQDVVDGTAGRSEQEAVEAHVARCPECAQCLEETRQLVGLISAVPSRRVSDDFERNLMAAIRQAEPVSTTVSWWERFRLQFEWRLRVPAMVAAGSLATALVAAAVVPPVVQMQRQHAINRQLADSVTRRHQQLQRADPHANWEAVEASIELSTGSITSGNL